MITDFSSLSREGSLKGMERKRRGSGLVESESKYLLLLGLPAHPRFASSKAGGP